MKEYVDLAEYTTFRMPSQARYFVAIKSISDILEAFDFAKLNNLSVFVLGGGSNILLNSENFQKSVVLKIEIPGLDVIEESNDNALIKIGAGENWDGVVAKAVEKNLSGIEALSAIPGTAGATPIQNVGAYGTEIADVLESLEAYEIATGAIKILTKEDCGFKYRDSIFKNEALGKYIITSITLRLSKSQPQVPDYPGVKKYFDEHKIEHPTLQQIREAIIAIRKQKLPDPQEVASVGSFFKNPIVTKEHYKHLADVFPDVVAFELADGRYKISAGWILESLGYKGKTFGNLQFYPNNALVLVNLGGADFVELAKLVEEVKQRVMDVYDIGLEIEPVIV